MTGDGCDWRGLRADNSAVFSRSEPRHVVRNKLEIEGTGDLRQGDKIPLECSILQARMSRQVPGAPLVQAQF